MSRLTQTMLALVACALSTATVAPAEACSLAGHLRIAAIPDQVGPGVVFPIQDDFRSELDPTLEGPSGPVALQEPKIYEGGWLTVAPASSLPPGDYSLALGGESNEVREFEVVEDFPPTELEALTTMRVSRSELDDCSGGPWTLDFDLRNSDGMPPVAFFLHEFDGREAPLAASPLWFEGESWSPGLTEASYRVFARTRPECVDLTAVLTTGELVSLGTVCDRFDEGCSTGGESPAGSIPTILLVLGCLLVTRARSVT